MVTAKYFRKLKEEYCLKGHYSGYYDINYIVLPNETEESKLIIVPYVNTINIVEVSSEEITYYGSTGRKIKGTYVFRHLGKSAIIKDHSLSDMVIFFRHRCLDRLDTVCALIQAYYDPNMHRLISDLKSANISHKGLYWFIPKDYDLKTPITSSNIIREIFKLSAKDLRYLQKQIELDKIDNYLGDVYIDRILKLKKVFSDSIDKILPYCSVYDYVDSLYSVETMIDSGKKDALKFVKMDFVYYLKLKRYNRSYQCHTIYHYRDYRRIRNELIYKHGVVLSKTYSMYPQDFSKIDIYHDELMKLLDKELMRVKESENKEIQEKYERTFYLNAKKLEYVGEVYSIKACKNLMELVEEGNKLNHCVGSYINAVASGKEYILFLRKNTEPEEPFFTIDVCPHLEIRQIHGKDNRNMDKNIKPFVKQWAKKFKLSLSNCSGIKGAL